MESIGQNAACPDRSGFVDDEHRHRDIWRRGHPGALGGDRERAGNAGVPELSEGIQQWPVEFEKHTKISWSEMLASLGARRVWC